MFARKKMERDGRKRRSRFLVAGGLRALARGQHASLGKIGSKVWERAQGGGVGPRAAGASGMTRIRGGGGRVLSTVRGWERFFSLGVIRGIEKTIKWIGDFERDVGLVASGWK